MKKVITIVIVVLVVIAFAVFLFIISPQSTPPSSYNGLVSTSGAKHLDQPPAFDPKTDHYQGNPNAKNVFIEYGDMQCPACAAYHDMMKQVPTTFPDTVFVFRYFPLVQIHQNTVEATLAVEAAGAQGKYLEMHDKLFNTQSDWEALGDPINQFAQYAQQVGVPNIDQFKSDITSKKYLSVIQQDSDQANGLNLQGTPSFF